MTNTHSTLTSYLAGLGNLLPAHNGNENYIQDKSLWLNAIESGM
jgi:hypothetical protein